MCNKDVGVVWIHNMQQHKHNTLGRTHSLAPICTNTLSSAQSCKSSVNWHADSVRATISATATPTTVAPSALPIMTDTDNASTLPSWVKRDSSSSKSVNLPGVADLWMEMRRYSYLAHKTCIATLCILGARPRGTTALVQLDTILPLLHQEPMQQIIQHVRAKRNT